MKRSKHTIPDASVLPAWRRSSYSGESGGNCLEVTDPTAYAAWRKSSYSGGDSGECLEVNDSALPARIPVRDSKNPAGPAVTFSAPAWTAFVTILG
ncbi:DUF397 domain-containing protein [Streptomyces sp. ActVer]|uniref:DUF397 domain-containing protein n=1 Tax=Streptomyces sp. ActVer TaxID=3014558 RepID=UPI0022B3F1B2|nr:DUF397 domain-containing protein [Streptomyces sp. ActVer]MCZ4514323.1 DUF397 domain-containing protein [Streptomyces sp. ActVer]